jgi:hypothetical protein
MISLFLKNAKLRNFKEKILRTTRFWTKFFLLTDQLCFVFHSTGGQRVPYTGNFGRDSARGPCQPKRENDWALAESSQISQENKKDVVTDQTDLEEDYTDQDRGNARQTLLISKYDRKRDWYSGFAHGCSRKESFAFKSMVD